MIGPSSEGEERLRSQEKPRRGQSGWTTVVSALLGSELQPRFTGESPVRTNATGEPAADRPPPDPARRKVEVSSP
jgi:hypothetical protein